MNGRLAFRLTYLAIHEHQHWHARKEARERMHCEPKHGVGNFDYECPNAKFIVSDLRTEGMGHSLRYGAVSSLLLGLGTDRVVLYPTPWIAASCKERHSHQCFFMPMTPCVITQEELDNAPLLSNGEVSQMRRTGVVDDKYKDKRVIKEVSSSGLNGNLQPATAKRPYWKQSALYTRTRMFWKRMKVPWMTSWTRFPTAWANGL